MPDTALSNLQDVQGASRKGFLLQPLFAKAVFALDRGLQKSNGVFCYSSDPKCLFRINLGKLEAPVVLENGTHLPAGSPVVSIHIWNEHVPVPAGGANPFNWGLQAKRAVVHSLRLLSGYLASRPDCDGVAAIHGDMALGPPEQTAQLLRLCRALGFVSPSDGNKVSGSYAHRLGENILIAMLVIAQNPRAFRLDCLRRDRVRIFMTREDLDRRFGAKPMPKRPASDA